MANLKIPSGIAEAIKAGKTVIEVPAVEEDAELSATEAENYGAAKAEIKLEYDARDNLVWHYYGTTYTDRKVDACRHSTNKRCKTTKRIYQKDWERVDEETAAEILSKYGLTVEKFIEMQDAEAKELVFAGWAKNGFSAEYLLEVGSVDEETVAEYRTYLERNKTADKVEGDDAPEIDVVDIARDINPTTLYDERREIERTIHNLELDAEQELDDLEENLKFTRQKLAEVEEKITALENGGGDETCEPEPLTDTGDLPNYDEPENQLELAESLEGTVVQQPVKRGF